MVTLKICGLVKNTEHFSHQCNKKFKYLSLYLQAHCLKKEQLAKRVVHVIDIANDPIKNSVRSISYRV